MRTAICVEVRDGLLHIFMPPTETIEDYLDLAAAIEDVAEASGQKLVLEGYAPPYDPRIQSFSVTPDPGVIEVNIHPAESWEETVRNTDIVYEEARATGLVTEKFLIDGKHVGTGGGNHMTLGGVFATDSPNVAAARSPAQPHRLLAQSPIAVLSLLRAFSSARPASIPVSMKAATTRPTSSKSPFKALDAASGQAVLAGRSHLPQCAHRHDGQHASRGVLHR